ncbi:MAG: sensor histidine kinase [Eubacteriales bacterium]|nr:sensor histidine kinase [Eubacteriales bacterium]
MKNVSLYLKSRVRIIAAVIITAVVWTVVFFLYSVPAAPIIYAYELLGFMSVVAVLFDYTAFYRKHKELKRAIKCDEIFHVRLYETNNQIEKDYQELVAHVIEQKHQAEDLRIKAMTQMRDYYCLWAHQIKTPIAAMDMLLKGKDEIDGTACSIDVSELKRQLFNVDFYVDAVMNYLRLEGLSSDFVFKTVSVNTVVKKAVKKFAAQFIGRKISISLKNLECNVKTDEKWLGFIIEQIISNAVKYTQTGGKIKIYMKETFNSSYRVLVIEDNGIGILDEDIPRIFERGYTGYNGRMGTKSSGIGLYLSKKAADKLGVTLSIHSQLNKGTKVLIDITQKHMEHE